MAVCQSNDDCRAQYVCVDTSRDPLRQVVDQNPSTRKICAVPASGEVSTPTSDPAVCQSPDAAPAAPEAGMAEGGTDGAGVSEGGDESDASAPEAAE